MEPPQAKVFARAFELGMLRVLSVVATKQEALQTKQELKQEFKDEIATLRNEMRFYMLINFGILGAVLGVIISKL